MAIPGLSVNGGELSPEGDLRRGAEEASHKILPTRTRNGQKRKCLARLVILVKISNYSSINLDVYGSTSMIGRYCGGYEDLSSHAVRLLSVQSRGNPGQLSLTVDLLIRDADYIYLSLSNEYQGTSRPTHYHVLYDENNFSADNLQMFTNKLCYTYLSLSPAGSPSIYNDLFHLFSFLFSLSLDLSCLLHFVIWFISLSLPPLSLFCLYLAFLPPACSLTCLSSLFLHPQDL